MSFTAALLLIAQSAAPALGGAPAAVSPSSQPSPVAAQARASARILRPARIAFDKTSGTLTADSARNSSVQQRRDAAGTVWLEFS